MKTNKELTFKSAISETVIPAGARVDFIHGEYFINPADIPIIEYSGKQIKNYSAIHEATYYGFRVNKSDIDFN